MKPSTYLFSTTVAAAGCLLIERSVVKSPAAAALKRVLGHVAKLLSKNVQLLPLVRLMRVCLTGRIKPKKQGCFSAFQLPPEVEFAARILKWKRCCVTVSWGDSSLRTRIVEAGCCQTVSSYAWLAVKIRRDQLWRV